MIEVLNGGTRATIQDAGRPGYRHLGIPQSGAADKLSFALANWMAGNRWDAPAIECALGGLHLKFTENITIALAGAEMWAQINGMNVKNFSPIPVEKGDILTLSFARDGCRAYIAVAGGLKVTEFMGSASTYLPPILMLADGHCTGGYPRALQVIRADLWLLGQIAPGSQVSFRRCFTENASKILAGRNSFYGGKYGGLIDGFAF